MMIVKRSAEQMAEHKASNPPLDIRLDVEEFVGFGFYEVSPGIYRIGDGDCGNGYPATRRFELEFVGDHVYIASTVSSAAGRDFSDQLYETESTYSNVIKVLFNMFYEINAINSDPDGYGAGACPLIRKVRFLNEFWAFDPKLKFRIGAKEEGRSVFPANDYTEQLTGVSQTRIILMPTPSELGHALQILGVDLTNIDTPVVDQAMAIKVKMDRVAQGLSDVEALGAAMFYEEWKAGVQVERGQKRSHHDRLYECCQAHITQYDWAPGLTPALWRWITVEMCPQWIAPIGGHDAYKEGETVMHRDKKWISTIGSNVWEPGVYGWSEWSE